MEGGAAALTTPRGTAQYQENAAQQPTRKTHWARFNPDERSRPGAPLWEGFIHLTSFPFDSSTFPGLQALLVQEAQVLFAGPDRFNLCASIPRRSPMPPPELSRRRTRSCGARSRSPAGSDARGRAIQIARGSSLRILPPGRHGSGHGLDRVSAGQPGVESAQESGCIGKACFPEFQRQTGAGRFIRSGAIEHEVRAGGEFAEVDVQLFEL